MSKNVTNGLRILELRYASILYKFRAFLAIYPHFTAIEHECAEKMLFDST